MTMHAEDFRTRLQTLELSQMDAARALLTKHKSVNNWYNASRRVPGPVQMLLDLYTAHPAMLEWAMRRNADWKVL